MPHMHTSDLQFDLNMVFRGHKTYGLNRSELINETFLKCLLDNLQGTPTLFID